MSEQEKYVCRVCDEDITEEYEAGNLFTCDLSDELLCESCYDSDLDNPSTLYLFQTDGESFEMRIGDHRSYHGNISDCYDDGVPKWLRHAWPTIWEGRNYVSTGGYRGYYATDTQLNLAKIADGWATGSWDDVRHKWDLNTFVERLQEGTLTPPADFYVLYEPTSNVFSQACTLLCNHADLETLTVWLEGLVESENLDVVSALG
jgi:hypothetical protein